MALTGAEAAAGVPNAEGIVIDADILARYSVGELLGKGSYGTVYAAEDRKTHRLVAIKIMPKEKLGGKGQLAVRNEIAIMSLLQHPKILRLHHAIYSRENITLVLDYVHGGELFKHLLSLQHYSERTAAEVMRNLMQAVQYMHSEGITHRDLKLEQLLLIEKPLVGQELTDIKLADFGFATKFRGEVMTQPCGTPYYLAPEVIAVGLYKTRSSYNELVDIWSCGVIAFILLAGYPPFNGKDKTQLFAAITRGVPDFSKPVWTHISPVARDFLAKLMEPNPQLRFTADQALKHEWLAGDDSLRSDEHLSESLESMREFCAREKIKGAVLGVEATLRMAYLADCRQSKMKTNSSILEMLTSATEPLQRIDLKNNYLGPAGVEHLMGLLAAHSSVTYVDLTNALIDDETCTRILTALTAPTSRVTTLVLDDNPLTHATGRKILTVLQSTHLRLRRISVEGTHISDSIKRKIRQQIEYNEEVMLVSRQIEHQQQQQQQQHHDGPPVMKPQTAEGPRHHHTQQAQVVAQQRPSSTSHHHHHGHGGGAGPAPPIPSPTASRLPPIGGADRRHFVAGVRKVGAVNAVGNSPRQQAGGIGTPRRTVAMEIKD